MMSDDIKKVVRSTENIFFIEDKNVLPYMTISDVLISDTSSIIGEFCAFDKPIVTFKTNDAPRFTEEIKQLISDISFQIKDFNELKTKLNSFINNRDKHKESRKKYNKIMFNDLDGNASLRMSKIIKTYLSSF